MRFLLFAGFGGQQGYGGQQGGGMQGGGMQGGGVQGGGMQGGGMQGGGMQGGGMQGGGMQGGGQMGQHHHHGGMQGGGMQGGGMQVGACLSCIPERNRALHVLASRSCTMPCSCLASNLFSDECLPTLHAMSLVNICLHKPSMLRPGTHCIYDVYSMACFLTGLSYSSLC